MVLLIKFFKCTDFVFDHSVWEKTTITEFELICDKSKKAEVPDAVYMAGMAVSMVLMGGVSDMYGRQVLWWIFLDFKKI